MMLGPVQWITSLLNEKQFMLVGVEFLVVVISGLFVAMSIMNKFTRHRSHGGVRRSILDVLDGVAEDVFTYALGAMVAVSHAVGGGNSNPLFAVWAMVIVGFHSGNLRTSQAEMFCLLQFMVLPLTSSRSGSPLRVQIWLIWVLLMLRCLYRHLASFKRSTSRWTGYSSNFIPDYMRPDHGHANLRPEVCNPSTMEGYTYLVYGESKQRSGMVKPQYIWRLEMVDSDLLITLDKIWLCDGRLLSRSSGRGDNLKDLCLAFALSGILDCRAQDKPLHRDCLAVTRGLVRSKIVARNAERAFAILEMELAFLNEKLHTWYPMVFWHGLLSLSLSLLRSLVTLGAACWLAVDIARVYKPTTEGSAMDNRIRGINVDIIITWVLMSFMILKEVWEMCTYLLSDWTKLMLVCKYVQWADKSPVVEKLIRRCLGRCCDVGGRWHGLFDQYEFLGSLDYVPTSWNQMHRFTLGMLPEKEHGAKLSGAVNVPACTKAAVVRALRSMNLQGGRWLPSEIPALGAAGLMDRFGWACQLPSCSQIILVWHIATSLCEIELAEDRGVELGGKIPPGFLTSTLSWLKGLICCSPQPFLVDESAMDGHLKTDYLVANSLSRYCAYLMISQPDLLPDSLLLPNVTFAAAVRDARQILKCDGDSSLHARYKQLIQEAQQGILEDDTLKQTGNTVRQGAFLAWNLIVLIGNRQLRWKILAEVWAGLIIHMAPTPNPEAHIERLKSGGEFITFIWALLTQLGIDDSSFWSRHDEATPTTDTWSSSIGVSARH